VVAMMTPSSCPRVRRSSWERTPSRDFFTAEFASDVVTTAQVSTSIQIEGEGNQAFDRGTFSWKGIGPGASDSITDVGKYVVIVRRTADGSWLKVAAFGVQARQDLTKRPEHREGRGMSGRA
jgi:hypothetical protein